MKISTELLAWMACVAPLTLQGQDSRTPLEVIPQIAVVARGEIKISPDRATIQISVQTRAATAAAAAADNANKQQSVMTALRALGLGNDQLSTINYNVYPEQRYEQGKEPVIDAALSHGANMITSLQFYASNTETARRTAITSAVEKARADAEVAARAARGSLGTLLGIDIGSYSPPPPRPMMMGKLMAGGAAQADTPINPGEETLSVEVSTRWRFIPAQ